MRKIIFICSLFLSSFVYAQSYCEGRLLWKDVQIEQEEKLSWLRGREFERLESFFSEKVKLYEAGKMADDDLFWLFGAFERWGNHLTPFFSEWEAKYPKSYSAKLGKAMHYSAIGWNARGGEFIDKTSAQQLKDMDAAFDIAAKLFLESMTLSKKPLLSYAGLMNLGKMYGSMDSIQTILAKANQIDPQNTIARRAYVFASAPKWGGSESELKVFPEQQRKEGLSLPQYNYIKYLSLTELGNHYRRITKQPNEAIKAYSEATKYCKLEKPWEMLASLYYGEKKYREALDSVNAALAYLPDNATLYKIKGSILKDSQGDAQAFASFQKAAELGDIYSTNMVGGYYAMGLGGQPKNLRLAIPMFERAAAQGSVQAKQNLEKARTELKTSNSR